MSKIKRIGILTAGGDCPGLNAAIRAVGKAALGHPGIEILGVRDGFLGLLEERFLRLDWAGLGNLLTTGGTLLGTSRVKPHRMKIGGHDRDLRPLVARNCRKHGLHALVCIGGGGTNKNALRLAETGIRLITIPKTIDNDVVLTESTIGYDTAVGVATEALDRLHSTAHSHHRIIVAEIMGHRAGWLALAAGVAAGADVILIPEIPYDPHRIAKAIQRRRRNGTSFSLVAVAEGAMSVESAARFRAARNRRDRAGNEEARARARAELAELDRQHSGNTLRLAAKLEELTGLESRVTILGYVQRGGAPSPGDRLLATQLGTACIDLLLGGAHGVMTAASGASAKAVPLDRVAGRRRQVAIDHPWIQAARCTGTCFGD